MEKAVIKIQRWFRTIYYWNLIQNFKNKSKHIGHCCHQDHWLSKIPVYELMRDSKRYQSILTAEKIKKYGKTHLRCPNDNIIFEKDWTSWNIPAWSKDSHTLKYYEVDLKF